LKHVLSDLRASHEHDAAGGMHRVLIATEKADNIVLVGGPGTGKTHIATAFGVQAAEHRRKRVRFHSTVDLVNALEQEKAAGKSGQIAARLLHADPLILDELGYLPFSASGGTLLSHLLSKLYEQTNVIITIDLSFRKGAAIFGDANITSALLDRLIPTPTDQNPCVQSRSPMDMMRHG
jgi:DNA replication protein DnaC